MVDRQRRTAGGGAQQPFAGGAVQQQRVAAAGVADREHDRLWLPDFDARRQRLFDHVTAETPSAAPTARTDLTQEIP